MQSCRRVRSIRRIFQFSGTVSLALSLTMRRLRHSIRFRAVAVRSVTTLLQLMSKTWIPGWVLSTSASSSISWSGMWQFFSLRTRRSGFMRITSRRGMMDPRPSPLKSMTVLSSSVSADFFPWGGSFLPSAASFFLSAEPSSASAASFSSGPGNGSGVLGTGVLPVEFLTTFVTLILLGTSSRWHSLSYTSSECKLLSMAFWMRLSELRTSFVESSTAITFVMIGGSPFALPPPQLLCHPQPSHHQGEK
mmetsp:Transcript_76038/g.134260  ORF Transcript_76038/g.134260 Transcript_76038/m.134260 type:complete len:249 (-) Transcript_76038:17-763(-)